MKNLVLIFFGLNLLLSQNDSIKTINKGEFPEGIYMTIKDVMNRKPSSNETIYFKNAITIKNDTIKSPEKVFFYFVKNNKKVLYPLAISHKGDMYFQTYRKYTNIKDMILMHILGF